MVICPSHSPEAVHGLLHIAYAVTQCPFGPFTLKQVHLALLWPTDVQRHGNLPRARANDEPWKQKNEILHLVDTLTQQRRPAIFKLNQFYCIVFGRAWAASSFSSQVVTFVLVLDVVAHNCSMRNSGSLYVVCLLNINILTCGALQCCLNWTN